MTTRSHEILIEAEDTEITTKIIMKKFNISHARSHSLLEKLRLNGNLTRNQINISESGGRFFEYSITKSGLKRLEYIKRRDNRREKK